MTQRKQDAWSRFPRTFYRGLEDDSSIDSRNRHADEVGMQVDLAKVAVVVVVVVEHKLLMHCKVVAVVEAVEPGTCSKHQRRWPMPNR